MSRWLWIAVLALSVASSGQSSNSGNSQAPSSSKTQTPAVPSDDSNKKQPDAPPVDSTKSPQPDLSPPRSDRVNASQLPDDPGESSSKDTLVDLSPPPSDNKAHPQSSEILQDVETSPDNGDVGEFHPWDPHKAVKDIEIGDFYFKQKNYRAAESRYREALYYKQNDAIATLRLAECLEKLNQPEEAAQEYDKYLKTLPHGPEAERAQKAIAKLKAAAKPNP